MSYNIYIFPKAFQWFFCRKLKRSCFVAQGLSLFFIILILLMKEWYVHLSNWNC